MNIAQMSMKMKTLENIKPFETETGKSFGSWSRTGLEVKVSFLRPDGMIICRSEVGNRFNIISLIELLKRTDEAGKGWQIDEITEREHKNGIFTERTYSGKGLDYLFESTQLSQPPEVALTNRACCCFAN